MGTTTSAAGNGTSQITQGAVSGSYLGVVADQAAMLALVFAVKGDKVKRTDLGGMVFEVIGLPPTVINNWLEYGGGAAPAPAPASVYADNYADAYA